jgi:hypothetical protein
VCMQLLMVMMMMMLVEVMVIVFASLGTSAMALITTKKGGKQQPKEKGGKREETYNARFEAHAPVSRWSEGVHRAHYPLKVMAAAVASLRMQAACILFGRRTLFPRLLLLLLLLLLVLLLLLYTSAIALIRTKKGGKQKPKEKGEKREETYNARIKTGAPGSRWTEGERASVGRAPAPAVRQQLQRQRLSRTNTSHLWVHYTAL